MLDIMEATSNLFTYHLFSFCKGFEFETNVRIFIDTYSTS